MSAAHGLLNSVFSCSSPASKAIAKRRLRQTRSLDPAIIRHCETEGASGTLCPGAAAAAGDAGASPERWAVMPSLRARIPTIKEPITPSLSSPSIPLDVSPSSNFHFDYDTLKLAKRNTATDLPFLVRAPGAAPSGSTGTLFSPRRWLQKKAQPSSSHAYVVWKSEVSESSIPNFAAPSSHCEKSKIAIPLCLIIVQFLKRRCRKSRQIFCCDEVLEWCSG